MFLILFLKLFKELLFWGKYFSLWNGVKTVMDLLVSVTLAREDVAGYLSITDCISYLHIHMYGCVLGNRLDFPVHTLLKIPHHLLAAANTIYRNWVLEIIARSNIFFLTYSNCNCKCSRTTTRLDISIDCSYAILCSTLCKPTLLDP